MIEERIQNLLKSEEFQIPFDPVIGDLPGSEENNVCILLASSGENTEYMGERNCSTLYNPLVQIIVRNKSYDEGNEWVETTQNILHRYNDNHLLSVLLIGSPVYLGKSIQKLHEFQLTFSVMVL